MLSVFVMFGVPSREWLVVGRHGVSLGICFRFVALDHFCSFPVQIYLLFLVLCSAVSPHLRTHSLLHFSRTEVQGSGRTANVTARAEHTPPAFFAGPRSLSSTLHARCGRFLRHGAKHCGELVLSGLFCFEQNIAMQRTKTLQIYIWLLEC